jgi:hypothetical protein
LFDDGILHGIICLLDDGILHGIIVGENFSLDDPVGAV